MSRRDERKWALTDHLCRDCGGRVLQCVAGGGITGGGNPIWQCADCGKASSDLTAACICWCGMSHRGNHGAHAYMCAPFEVAMEMHPEGSVEIRQAFGACGCNPVFGRGQVGILLRSDYLRIMKDETSRRMTRDRMPTDKLVAHPLLPKWKFTALLDGHWWGYYKTEPFQRCRICDMTRPLDPSSKSPPCKGQTIHAIRRA